MTADAVIRLLAVQAVQLSIVIIATAAASRLLSNRRPHVCYALWMVVLAKAVTPPVWGSPTGLFSWTLRGQASSANAVVRAPAADVAIRTSPTHFSEARQPGAVVDFVAEPQIRPTPSDPENSDSSVTVRELHVPNNLGKAAGSNRPTVPSAREPLGPAAWILIAWVTGASAVLASTVLMTAALRRSVARAAVLPNSPAMRRLAGIADSLGDGRPARLVVTTNPIGPALVGLFRPVVVMPLHLIESLCDRELRSILVHETAHLRRRDHWIAALQRCVVSVWWFHPLVWFANRQIGRARELCCDVQAVAELNCDPADYAQMLLDVLRLRRQTPLNQSLFPGVHAMQITTKRLSALLTNRGTFPRRAPASAWIVLAVAGLAVIPGSGLIRTLAAEPASAIVPTTGPAGRALIFHGMLSDGRHNWPLAGATVTVRFTSGMVGLGNAATVESIGTSTTSTTGADGRYDVVVPADLIARDPQLSIFIQMHHPNYGYRTLAAQWLPGFQGELDWVRQHDSGRATLPCLDIHLAPADQWTGTLVGQDRRPLADATVAVTSCLVSPTTILNDRVRTDAAGRFAIPAFTGGRTSLLIQPHDAAAFRLAPTGDAADGQLDLGVIVAPAGQPVTGTILDANANPVASWVVAARPVAGGPIAFDDEPVRSTTTDAAGRFTLDPVAAGEVKVTVTDPSRVILHQEFPEGMSVPQAYNETANSAGYTPVVINVPGAGRTAAVAFRPNPLVRITVRSVDPAGHPAEPLATFVTGKLNGINGAWMAVQSGPDTVEALVPKGVTGAMIGINDLSADDGRTVARVRRGDGPAVDAGMTDLGTIERDITDITVVRYPRPELAIAVTDAQGRPLPTANAAVRYVRPAAGNPYSDRLTRGAGSPQPWRSQAVFPNQPFVLTVSLEGYTTESRGLTLGWDEHRSIDVRLTRLPSTQTAEPGRVSH